MGGCVKYLGIACVTLKVLGLISSLVGLGIPYWYVGDTTESAGVSGTVKTTIREGLWKKCTVLESTTEKTTFCVGNDVTTSINAIRWLIFIGAGIHGIGVLAAGAAHMEKNRTAYIVAAVHGLLSIILHSISAALYATVVKDDIGFETKHLYIGWGMIFICVVFTLVAVLLALMLARMSKSTTKNEVDQMPMTSPKNDAKKGKAGKEEANQGKKDKKGAAWKEDKEDTKEIKGKAARGKSAKASSAKGKRTPQETSDWD